MSMTARSARRPDTEAVGGNASMIAAKPHAAALAEILGFADGGGVWRAAETALIHPDVPGLVRAAGGVAHIARAWSETHPGVDPRVQDDAAAGLVLRTGDHAGWDPRRWSPPESWGAAGVIALHAAARVTPSSRACLERHLPWSRDVLMASVRILTERLRENPADGAVARAVVDCPWVFHPADLRSAGLLDAFWNGHPALMLCRRQDGRGLDVLVDGMPTRLRSACADGHPCIIWFAERHGRSLRGFRCIEATKDPGDGTIYGTMAVDTRPPGSVDGGDRGPVVRAADMDSKTRVATGASAFVAVGEVPEDLVRRWVAAEPT